MSAPEPGPETPLRIHRLQGRRSRFSINPGWIIGAVLLAMAFAGAAYVMMGPRVVPLSLMPPGVPSVSEARACWRSGDLGCAEADYLAYLKRYPNDLHANASLALILTEDGRHREALPYYKKALDGGESTYDLQAGYARSLEATGDLDGAIKANRASLELVPQLVDVRGALARQLVKKGKAQEAVDLLESFDHDLVEKGEQPYFAAQIREIKTGMGGEAARQVQAEKDKASAEAKVRDEAAARARAEEAATAAAPQEPAKPGITQVLLKRGRGVMYVPVLLNGSVIVENFVVDSGATHVVITRQVATELIARGKLKRSDYRGQGFAVLADGSRVPSQMIILRSLTVGGRELRDVTAVITNGDGASLLLGQSFLKRFKSWSIDNRRGVLKLED